MRSSELTIRTSSGEIRPIGPGQFIEHCVGFVKHPPLETTLDDLAQLTLIEMGSMLDEDSLKFRQKRLKLKEILDLELLPEIPENAQFRRAAITHFGIQELHRFNKSLKNSIPEISGDLTMQDIDNLAIEFMKENGNEGRLIWMKNSIIIVDDADFKLHLCNIKKHHKRATLLCGALFCERPYRVVKASFSGRVCLT